MASEFFMPTSRIIIASFLSVVAAFPMLFSVGCAGSKSEPLHLFVAIPLKDFAAEPMLPLMLHNVRESRKEPGNISFDAFFIDESPKTILLFESWRNDAALEAHNETMHLQGVRAAFGAGDLTPPGASRTLVKMRGVAARPAYTRPNIPDPAATRNIFVHFHVLPDRRDEFIATFAAMIPQARKAPGNYIYELHQSIADPNEFVLFERWASVATHEAHLAQPYSVNARPTITACLAGPPTAYMPRYVPVDSMD